MERIWTAGQLSAIETKGCDLLVSAGAGSGKTAVLTERIIRRLTDDPNAEITRMLIVTFTKSAAGELRERISSALSEALAADPKSKRLSRQLMQLDRAKICTIHSFCLDLLRENFTAAGLTADFRVADEAEIKLLRRSLMNELIEDCYGGRIEGFDSLADCLTGTKGDAALEDIFLGLYEDLSSYREGIGFITSFADELEADSTRDFGLSRCGQQMTSLVYDSTRSYLDSLVDILPSLEADEKLKKAYFPAFSYDVEFIRGIGEICTKRDYSELKAHFDSYSPPRLGTYRGELDDEIISAKALRDALKKKLSELSAKFFSLTPEQISKDQTATAAMLRRIAKLLELFDSSFTAEKRRRNIVDFTDLERLACGLLTEGGKPSELAKAVSSNFDEIFIDEYQDVNSLQDAIFSAISSSNRFMVGDVKQSIYSFRGAEPEIFESYRGRFGQDGENGKTVFLSNNFRCDKNIIEFANLVSGCIFTNATGALPYYPEDDLVYSKSGVDSAEPVTIALLPKENEDDEDAASEAEYVASEIEKLLASGVKNNGEPIELSDIAILVRSAAAQAEEFRSVFEKHSIPLYNNAGGDFFENAEVLLALCLLNVIDDPHRDIYLAGLLKSPLFGFTLDELTLIRRHSKDGCLFDALKAYTADNDFKKGSDFLETLRRYQRKAEELPVDRLIWYLYTDTDLPALVYGGEGGNVRRANLTLLYEYARRFEGSSFRGLYNFIRYINDIIADKTKLEPAKIFSEASKTVKLMTIHQSKGLEFPVVFLCGCGKQFNDRDTKANIVAARSLGVAMKLPDSTGFARFDTPVRQAIVKKLADSQLEEEMRVLYVAMTRARERLYITAKVDDPESFSDKCYSDAKRLSRSVILQNGGYIKWILTSVEAHELRSESRPYLVIFPENVSPTAVSIKKTPEPTAETDAELDRLVRERFDFVYPRQFLTKLPAKLSVSELYPTVLDADAAKLEPDELPKITAKVPLFMQDAPAETASPAERGTATHCFMQFCDFSRFKALMAESGQDRSRLEKLVADECARLGEERYLSPRAASLVNQRQLVRFFESTIFAELCASGDVRREHRFNVKLPAADFTSDEELKNELSGESILVQGVIDCFFTNPDGSLTLLDYKTDYIPREISRAEAEKMLLERHRLQLGYYKKALALIASKPVSRCLIYSFGIGGIIPVD